LIDDNKIDLLFHEKLIRNKSLSAHITPLSSATDALQLLHIQYENETIPENLVILLDIQMPVMDGLEFLSHLEKMPASVLRKIRVFCVSSAWNKATIKRCESHPLVNGILDKPLNAEELIKLLEYTGTN